MKRLLCLLLLSAMLCGCAAAPGVQPTEPEPIPVIEMPTPKAPEATPPTTAVETAPVQTEPPTYPLTDPSTELPSEPQTEPNRYQYGDTTPTWDPARADRFPADGDCSDETLLEKWMAVEGLTLEDLDARGCNQLILAVAQPTDGVEALVVCYARDREGRFAPAEPFPRFRGHVGKNGILHDRRINSYTSPAGLWSLSFAFGNELPPEGLKLPWRQVTPNSEWVCDEASVYFNTWQELDDPALTETWGDKEHLESYPTQYAYACVIEFNRGTDMVPARGCAIFLHCGDGGTAGCVSLPTADMRAVLLWLDPAEHPYILITGVQSSE